MLAVIDTETTGVETTDQVIEIGVVLIGKSGMMTWSTLVKPTVPIHPSAKAAHHIHDDELADAPTAEEALKQCPMELFQASTVVAHNLAFDVRMLEQSGLGAMLPSRRVCTWKCARHVWPQAPSHSNQALRYWLNLKVSSALGDPHRAVADAMVTAALMQELLKLRTLEELIKLTSTPVLIEKVRVGKYKGQPWSEMDAGYCQWVLDAKEPFDEDVRYTARYWIDKKRRKAP